MSIFDRTAAVKYRMSVPDEEQKDMLQDVAANVIYLHKAGANSKKLFNIAIKDLYKLVTSQKKKDEASDDKIYEIKNLQIKLYPNGTMLVRNDILYNPNPSKTYTVDEIYNAVANISHETNEKMVKKAAAHTTTGKFTSTRFMKNVINTTVKHNVPLITLLCMGQMLGLKSKDMLIYLSHTCQYSSRFIGNDRTAIGFNQEAMGTYTTQLMNNPADFMLACVEQEIIESKTNSGHKTPRWSLYNYIKYLNIQQHTPATIVFQDAGGNQHNIAIKLEEVNKDYHMILAGLFTKMYGLESAKKSFYQIRHYYSKSTRDDFFIHHVFVPTTESLDRLAQIIKDANIKKELSWDCDVSDDIAAYLEEANVEYNVIDFDCRICLGSLPDWYLPTTGLSMGKQYLHPYYTYALNLLPNPRAYYEAPAATGYDVKTETGNIYNLLRDIAVDNHYIAGILISNGIVDNDLSFTSNYDEECLIVKGDIVKHEITETSIDEVIDIINDAFRVNETLPIDCEDASTWQALWNIIPSWKYKENAITFAYDDNVFFKSYTQFWSRKHHLLFDKNGIDEELRAAIMYLASYRYAVMYDKKTKDLASKEGFSEKYMQFNALADTFLNLVGHIIGNLPTYKTNKYYLSEDQAKDLIIDVN